MLEDREQNPSRRQMIGRAAGSLGIASVLGRRAAFAQASAGGYPQVVSYPKRKPIALSPSLTKLRGPNPPAHWSR